ncbi:hypothetical protein ABTD83_21800, partial [Acinetobacter baumannii]
DYAMLLATRPTAVNLRWALDEILAAVRNLPERDRARVAFARADAIADEDADMSRRIGEHGLPLIRALHAANPDRPVNI